jgi:single-stranded-DNA-specific exonuclease
MSKVKSSIIVLSLVRNKQIRYAQSMKKQWQILDPDQNSIAQLSRQLGCGSMLARLLFLRGLTTIELARGYLQPSLVELTSPLKLADMKTAVKRIYRALATKEKIMVFGDYDADGVTATVILVSFLQNCGAQVRYAIPHRLTDGYGLSSAFIKNRAMRTDATLIITVDCGSGNDEAIAYAKKNGIDTIVTDHHPVDPVPKKAAAVINPSRKDCTAKLNHLAGVGVAFYLVIALRTYLRGKNFWKKNDEPNLIQYCDLVALGTVADISSIRLENRILTATGLRRINRAPRPGIASLMRKGKIPEGPVTAETIAFQLAPRLNAAGRLAHARIASELLLSESKKKANRLAKALCRLNSRRKDLENELLETILVRLESDPKNDVGPVLVVHGEGWHEGLLGIAAARLVRMFDHPAIVISTCNGKGKGSGRSIEGIDLSFALSQCADLLDRYGGHPLAAGLTLPSSKIEAFTDRLTRVVDHLHRSMDSQPTITIDARVPITDVTPALMNELERMEPFGQGNPPPRFFDPHVHVLSSNRIGINHRKFVLANRSGMGDRKEAIQFNVSEPSPSNGDLASIIYRPQWNYWKGNRRLQLLIEAFGSANMKLSVEKRASFFD